MTVANWKLSAVLSSLLLAGCLFLGCDGPSRPTEQQPGAFQARQPLTAARATKQLGEDCTTYDGSECLSGVCFHYRPGRRDGYVCSQPCTDERECPEGWRCAGILPTRGNEFCVPPKEWAPRETSAPAPGSRQSPPSPQSTAAVAPSDGGGQLPVDGGIR